MELDNVSLGSEDLALLVGTAKVVMRYAQFPQTATGKLERAKLAGAIERADQTLGLHARALGSERGANGH